MKVPNKLAMLLFLLLPAAQLCAAPGDIIFQEQFNDTADLSADWSFTTGMWVNAVDGDASPSLALEGRLSSRSATSLAGNIDADLPGVTLSFWVRRGFDTQIFNCSEPSSCSEYPENGENLQVDYLNTSGSWIVLATYTGGGTSGEVFTFNQALPNDALHSGLQVRFTHLGGNTNQAGWDFWHVDNVVVTESTALPPPTVPAPRADWRMDELSWDGTSGEVIDSSGNGYNGTAFGASTTSGFICNAGDFSPTGTSDYLSLANGAMNGLTDFTVSTWVATTNTSSQGIVSGSSGTQHNEIIMWWTNQSTFQPHLKGSSSGGNISAQINNGAWRHLVWTRNGSQNCLYVDGVQQGNCVSRSASSLSIANGGLIIAQEQDSLGGGFSSSQDWEGSIDELLIFDSAFSSEQVTLLYNRQNAGNNWDDSGRSCPGVSSVDHYGISLPGTAISCEPLSVTIRAQDASHNLVDAQSATVTLTTSTGRGTWSGTGVTDATANDGTATLAFSSGNTSQTVQLSYPDLAGSDSETVNINVSDGSIGETSGSANSTDDPSVDVYDAGFRFIDQTSGSEVATLPNQVAGLSSDSTELSQVLYLQAVRTNTATGECDAVYPSGTTVQVGLAAEYRNPTSGARNLSIAGATVTPDDDNGGSGVSGSYTQVNLTFGADSKAAIPLRYDDAGALQLHAEDVVSLPGGVNATLVGSSNDFVVRPYQFAVTTVDDGSGGSNPGTTATTSGGNGFISSGTAFRVVVEAQDAQGDTTPNYGNETTSESVAVPQTPTLTYPTGVASVAGTLSNNSTFSATSTDGEFANTTISWNEVGTFTLRPDVADGDYLGTGLGAYAPLDSGNIGRFFPAGFNFSGSTTAGYSCGSFAYLSEPGIAIGYTLRALNVGGGVVTNYDNTDRGYSADAAHMGTVTYYAENANDGTDRGSRFSDGVTQTWDDGVYQVNASQAQFNRAAGIDGPFNSLQLSLSIAEPDGAALDGSALNQDPTNSGSNFAAAIGYDGSTYSPLILRYGRAVIESANGPETAALPVTFGLQQWNGAGFEDAATDSCSSIAFTEITFASNNPVVNPQAVTVGAGTSSGGLNSSGAAALAAGGTFGLSFSAPNDTGAFPVRVDLTNYPWLRFDWDQDGDFGNDTSLPDATISFGSYRGHDRVIYWRERF